MFHGCTKSAKGLCLRCRVSSKMPALREKLSKRINIQVNTLCYLIWCYTGAISSEHGELKCCWNSLSVSSLMSLRCCWQVRKQCGVTRSNFETTLARADTKVNKEFSHYMHPPSLETPHTREDSHAPLFRHAQDTSATLHDFQTLSEPLLVMKCSP